MQFENGWDEYLLKYMIKIQSDQSEFHKLQIIYSYPRAFDVIDIDKKIFKLLENDKKTHTITYREG